MNIITEEKLRSIVRQYISESVISEDEEMTDRVEKNTDKEQETTAGGNPNVSKKDTALTESMRKNANIIGIAQR